jgi:hypothetical protein
LSGVLKAGSFAAWRCGESYRVGRELNKPAMSVQCREHDGSAEI